MVIPKGSSLGPPGLQRRRTFKSASRATSYPYGDQAGAGGGSDKQQPQQKDGKFMFTSFVNGKKELGAAELVQFDNKL